MATLWPGMALAKNVAWEKGSGAVSGMEAQGPRADPTGEPAAALGATRLRNPPRGHSQDGQHESKVE